MTAISGILKEQYPQAVLHLQQTADSFSTIWISRDRIVEILRFLKYEIEQPYVMLYDLTAIDEQARKFRDDQPDSKFTVVYQLLSFERNDFLRLKVPLESEEPSLPSVTSVWPAADWYEREVYDLFWVNFEGHHNLRRILMLRTLMDNSLHNRYTYRASVII